MRNPKGKIVKELAVSGERGEERVPVLFDSGASFSLVRRDLAERLARPLLRLKRVKVFRLANGVEGLRATEATMLTLEMKGKEIEGSFYIVDGMPRPIIVGVDFLQKWEIRLDFKAEDYEIGVDPEAIEIACA